MGQMAVTTRKKLRYSKANSIIALDDRREGHLTNDEFAILYRFYVLEAPHPKQSSKCRSLASRDWRGIYSNGGLLDELTNILDLSSSSFVFLDLLESYDAKALCENLELAGCPLGDYEHERCMVSETDGNNLYLKVFFRLRNCLAHGNFKLLESKNQSGELLFLMEDHTTNRGTQTVTARMIFRKQTLIRWAETVAAGPHKD